MASVDTGDATGAGTWGELTIVAATTTRTDTVVAITMEATTMAMCQPTTTVRRFMAGPTIRGRRRLFIRGVGAERRGLDITATISIRTRPTPPRHCDDGLCNQPKPAGSV